MFKKGDKVIVHLTTWAIGTYVTPCCLDKQLHCNGEIVDIGDNRCVFFYKDLISIPKGATKGQIDALLHLLNSQI